MASYTQKNNAQNQPEEYLTSDEIYNEIMKEIEPALTSDRIEESMKKQGDETDEEYAARMEHYQWALDIFDEAALDFHVQWNDDVATVSEETRQKIAEKGNLFRDIDSLNQSINA